MIQHCTKCYTIRINIWILDMLTHALFVHFWSESQAGSSGHFCNAGIFIFQHSKKWRCGHMLSTPSRTLHWKHSFIAMIMPLYMVNHRRCVGIGSGVSITFFLNWLALQPTFCDPAACEAVSGVISATCSRAEKVVGTLQCMSHLVTWPLRGKNESEHKI